MTVRQTAHAEPMLRASRDIVAPQPDTAEAHAIVHLTLKIETIDALRVRRALHGALGDAVGIHVMTVDHRHHRTTLQLQTTRDHVDAIMDAIMGDLLEAEFGPLQPSGAAVH